MSKAVVSMATVVTNTVESEIVEVDLPKVTRRAYAKTRRGFNTVPATSNPTNINKKGVQQR